MRSILMLSNYTRYAILVSLLMAWSSFTGSAFGIGIVPPPPSNNSYYVTEQKAGLSLTNFDAPALFYFPSDYLKFDFKVDSTQSYISGQSLIRDPYFAQPLVYSLEDYKEKRSQENFRKSWRESVVRKLFQNSASTGSGAVEIEIPWRVRSKAFQKIFGGDKVGLRVTGNITINGGLRKQKTDQTFTTQNDLSNYSFHIDQTQRFNIEGKVGDKVSVFIDQDSERMFDFENSLKLIYTGTEDEIIQKIEAGNVALSLPGMRLATFSGTNKGLFGLKTESKIGPMKLTTIASVEKGQKNKKSLKGGAEETSIRIESTDLVHGKYFFLDEVYRENFRLFSETMEHIQSPDIIGEIYLYKKDTPSANTQGLKYGWAMLNPDRNNIPQQDDRNNKSGYFRLMDISEYYVDRVTGYIRLKNGLMDTDVLACAYTIPGDTIGDVTPLPDTMAIVLKLIRPDNPQPSDSTWDLEFRNVYSLKSTNIEQEGFAIEIFRTTGTSGADANTQNVGGQNLTYLNLLGLDLRGANWNDLTPDGNIDNNPYVIDWANGEILLPGLRPFDPDSASGFWWGDSLMIPPLDSSSLMPELYDTTYTPVSRYYFSVKYKNASALYNLGFNVLEGSEEIFLNGNRLNKGSGYLIDYMTGSLTILDPAASSPTANLEVYWESGEIFQLDKKTLLGVRGEYQLWNPESYIGSAMLYLNEKPLEERVKVDNEPIRNFILDANTAMNFKPQFLTSAIDFLPLIEAEVESRVTFEGEIARLYPNPNPLNNPATGDYNGVAYLDDFESVKRTTSLGIMRHNWTLSSIPPGVLEKRVFSNNTLIRNMVRGNLIWYNPYDQVPITNIWPDRPVNSSVASKVHVLNLNFTPHEETLGYNIPAYESWGGIQRYLSAGYADQSKAKFLELWVNTNDNDFTLNIDLGRVSEDAIPNDTLNNEDEPFEDMTFGNGYLDSGEDTGLDMMADGADEAITAGGDFWDINRDGVKQPEEPYSDDNFYYSATNKNNYTQIDGTEANGDDYEASRIPDTEDLNGNGTLDKDENFFRLAINFNDEAMDSLRVGNPNPYGWQQIRFPLRSAEIHGAPYWNQIEYVRIWLTGGTSSANPVQIQIATMDLVGNEWEVVLEDSTNLNSTEEVEIAVLNTYDNQEYEPPPGVRGLRDPITNIISKEQSLVLKVIDLAPADTAMIYKRFLSAMDFLKYNTLKMFVCGETTTSSVFVDSSLHLFFRFGTDTSSNYYEVYQKLHPGWATENFVEIDLREIATIKMERDVLLAGGILDTDTHLGSYIIGSDTVYFGYRIAPDGDSLVVKGNPSLSQIRQLTVGVINAGTETLLEEDGVEVWLDELRLSDVKKNPGTAYRASAAISFSDVGDLSANIQNQDPYFHNLNDRLDRLGSSAETSSRNLSGNMKLDKLLPPSWKLNLPVNANMSQTNSVPLYYPGSDILLEDPSAIDTVKNYSESMGWGIRFSRAGESSNKIIRYTIDKVNAQYDYSESYSSNANTVFAKNHSHSANLNYNLTFPGEHSFRILSWTKGIPLVKKLQETRFTYLISNVALSIAGAQQFNSSLTRTNVNQSSETFGLTRSVSTGWRPFSVMNFDFSRTHRSDMLGYEWNHLLQGETGFENSVNQTFGGSYNPSIFKWLTHDVNYNTTYSWTWGEGYAVSGQNIQSRNSINSSWSLKTSQLFKQKTKSKGPSKLLGPRPKNLGQPDSAKVQEPENIEEKRINPLQLLKSAVFKLTDIRFDYSHTRNLSTPAVTGQADWPYQLGFSKDPGVAQVANYGGSSLSSESYTDSYTGKSGYEISKSVRTNFDYSYKSTENYGNTINGNVSSTQYYMFSKKDGSIKHFPFINMSVRVTGLEKLKLFQKVAQTVSLESGISNKGTSDWNASRSNIIRTTYSRDFTPILGLSVTWKGDISSNIQVKNSQTLTDNIQSDQKNRSSNTTISLTGSYNRKSGFTIPLPVWPFRNKRFKNNTTFSLTFSASSRYEGMLTGDATKFSETRRTTQWSFMPKIDYTFSNTVNGGIHYETGVTTDRSTGKTSFHEFGFNVNISIRGK